jgi:hypothetical protein
MVSVRIGRLGVKCARERGLLGHGRSYVLLPRFAHAPKHRPYKSGMQRPPLLSQNENP